MAKKNNIHATNRQLYNLFNNQRELEGLTDAPVFLFVLHHNLHLIEAIIDEIRKLGKFTAEMELVSETFNNLHLEYRLKNAEVRHLDDKGRPPIDPNRIEEFRQKENEFKEKFAAVLELQREKNREVEKFLDKKSAITLIKVNIGQVPKSINMRQMGLIFPMVDGGTPT